MKTYLLSFILFTAIKIHAQTDIQSTDTVVAKSYLSLLQWQVGAIKKEELTPLRYKFSFYTKVRNADSVQYGKDSLIVNLRNNIRKLVVSYFVTYRTDMVDSTITYYNEHELPVYKEKIFKKIKTEKGKQIIVIDAIVYYRYKYDSKNRLSEEIIKYPTPKLIRRIYHYDDSGNLISITGDSKLTSLWD